MTTPAELSFAIYWQNHALQALFRYNREAAFETFKQVWATAIEEAASVAFEDSEVVALKIMRLK
jgi:hypothetical protein